MHLPGQEFQTHTLGRRTLHIHIHCHHGYRDDLPVPAHQQIVGSSCRSEVHRYQQSLDRHSQYERVDRLFLVISTAAAIVEISDVPRDKSATDSYIHHWQFVRKSHPFLVAETIIEEAR